MLDREVAGRPLLVAGHFAMRVLSVGDEQQVVALGAGARGELAELPLEGGIVTGPQGDVGQPERGRAIRVRALGARPPGDFDVEGDATVKISSAREVKERRRPPGGGTD